MPHIHPKSLSGDQFYEYKCFQETKRAYYRAFHGFDEAHQQLLELQENYASELKDFMRAKEDNIKQCKARLPELKKEQARCGDELDILVQGLAEKQKMDFSLMEG
jgi:hypothetical protein